MQNIRKIDSLNSSNKKFFTWQEIVFSVVSAIIMVSGKIFSETDTLRLPSGFSGVLRQVLFFIGFFVIFLAIFLFSCFLMDYLKKDNIRAAQKFSDDTLAKGKSLVKKLIPLFVFAGTFIYYLIWYYFLRPNIATYDTINQIAQAFGWINLRNDNPVFHTLLMRAVLKTAYFFSKDVLISISVYEVFQIFVFSVITTFALLFIEKLFTKKNILKWLLQAFFFVNPIVCFFTVILWKDQWLSYFCLALVMALYECIKKDNVNIKLGILLCITTFFVLMSKGTGILYIIFLMLFILFEKKKNLKSKYKIVLLLLCTTAFFEIFSNAFIKINNVGAHDEADTESVIWQTIGRTANKHLNEISKEDREAVSKFIDLDVAADQYNREIADPVRNCALNRDYFYSHKSECIKAWLNLGTHFKGTYLTAIYAMGYGYIYPECYYPNITYVNYVTISSHYSDMGIVFDPNLQSYDLDNAHAREAKVQSIVANLDNIRKIPVLGLPGKIGAYFILFFFLILYGNLRKKEHFRLFNAIPLAVLVGCIFSPVYSETRYAYPAMLMSPVVIAIFGSLGCHGDGSY